MKKFIDKTLKPVLVLTGLFTTSTGVLIFFPVEGLHMMFDLEMVGVYEVIIQHWGLVISMLGLCIVATAFKEKYRYPVLMFAAVEKFGLALIFVADLGTGNDNGFEMAAAFDFAMACYYSAYLYVYRQGNSLA